MHTDMQSIRRRETSMLLKIMHELAAAKAQGNIVDVWWSLEDLAMHAISCKTVMVRDRAIRELERHRSEFRTADCTDRFGSLAIFWSLPPNPFPYIEPANWDEAPEISIPTRP